MSPAAASSGTKKPPKSVKTGNSLSEALELGQGVERPFRCEEHEDHEASASVNVLKGVWFCLEPSTRVLTADLRWIPIGDVTASDELVGFDEHVIAGQRRSWRRAQVQGVARVRRRCYEVELADGTVIVASEDHQWLCYTSGSGVPTWRRTDQLFTRNGNPVRLMRLLEPWEANTSWQAGYAAAAFDGEGSFINRQAHEHQRNRQVRLIFYQSHNEMLDEFCKCLKDLGIEYGKYAHVGAIATRREHHKPMSQVAVQGKSSTMQALGILRPRRLLAKFDLDSMGVITPLAKPTVVRVTDVGSREVVAVQTSTGTYVAEGLASHNCYACGAKGVTDGKRVPKVEDLRAMVEPEATCRIYPEAYLELFANFQGNFGSRFDAATQWALSLGCDPLTGDATFPVRTGESRLAGVGRRKAVQDEGPRYVYPPRWAASRSMFFAAHKDNAQILVMTEGAGDASGVFEAGFDAAAVYGSGLHLPQVELIARIKPKLVVLALDADEAGLKGAHRARPVIEKRTPVLVHYWDRSHVNDPMELDPAGRREALSKTVTDGGYDYLMASPAALANDLRQRFAQHMESA